MYNLGSSSQIDPMMREIRVSAGGKINVGLSIGGRESNGYHGIRSIFASIDVCDSLNIRIRSNRVLEINGLTECAPEDSSIYKAAKTFLDAAGVDAGLSITVEKHIPSQAGLGGASADAAAVFAGLAQLYPLESKHLALPTLGAKVGSDVPFFLCASQAFVTGRGEIVEPILPRKPFSALILKPPFGVSTKEAFAGLDAYRTVQGLNSEGNPEPWGLANRRDAEISFASSPREWRFVNDFAPFLYSRYPMYFQLERDLKAAGASFVSVSGSGSCIYGIFEGEDEAREVRGRFSKKTIPGMALYAIKPLENTLSLG